MKDALEILGAVLVLAAVGMAKFGMPDFSGLDADDAPEHRYTSPDNPWAAGNAVDTGIRQPVGSPFAFRNCAEARAHGKSSIRRGENGYGAHLDRDGDGIACEPYRGRR